MKKELQIECNPIINPYTVIGFYLGLLTCRNFDFKGILFENYIQLFGGRRQLDFIKFNYIRRTYFKTERFDPLQENVIFCLKSCIDQGCYVCLILDEQYLDQKQVNRGYSYLHYRG